MKLKNVASGQEFHFDYGKMLKKEKGDSQIVVELPAIRPDIAPLTGKFQYRYFEERKVIVLVSDITLPARKGELYKSNRASLSWYDPSSK